jgi:aspartyl-tRNA(Asn)/glutamyl-tRNA(Gln) amidotransferase subunit B
MNTNYETVIGLEVHSELATQSKIFCTCENKFGEPENTKCCPVCTGMPGTLPVLNRQVVEYCMTAGLAMNCEISNYSKMDRKNYFYPDLPKAYQISQFDLPICKNGYIDIEVDGQTRRIRITRIHIEEDAGKLIHTEDGNGSKIDFNRCGVPLIEIVTEPDIRSSKEAAIFLETVRNILRYTGVSDCKMQEGSLRCDVNVSVRPFGQKEYGIRSELKNMNSFAAAVRAMEYEISRHVDILSRGQEVVQETRRWDDAKGVSLTMRSKEDSQDYRYFPEPDLMPIIIDDSWVKCIKDQLPELPNAKKERYINQLGLPEYDAGLITASKGMALFLDGCVSLGCDVKSAANWLMGDISRALKDEQLEIEQLPFGPEELCELLSLVEKKEITGAVAKKVLGFMMKENKKPKDIVKEHNLGAIDNQDAIKEFVKQVIEQNEKSVTDYKNGKVQAMGFLVGQTMKLSKGKTNPQMVTQLLKEMLDK